MNVFSFLFGGGGGGGCIYQVNLHIESCHLYQQNHVGNIYITCIGESAIIAVHLNKQETDRNRSMLPSVAILKLHCSVVGASL